MALRKGLRAVRQAKRAADDRRDSNDRRFWMRAAETATLRFWGDFESEEDPIIGTVHFIKKLPKGQQYQNCAENMPEGEHAGCVHCYQRDHGDKGIGKTSRAFFHVEDKRKYHKLEAEVRVLKAGVTLVPGVQPNQNDFTTTKYPPCAAPRRKCPYCAQGNKALDRGHSHWELAVTYADQLVSQQITLRDYCKCQARGDQGEGTIYVAQYLCGNCQEEVEFYPEQGHPVAQCGHCQQTLPPLEAIECAACDNPLRCDLQDFFFRVSRTGDSTDTTYNFEAIHPCRPPTPAETEAAEKNKPNWNNILCAEPAELQAATLGLPASPFTSTGHGAAPYGGNGGHSAEAAGGLTDVHTDLGDDGYADIDFGEPAAPPPAFAPPKPKPAFKPPTKKAAPKIKFKLRK